MSLPKDENGKFFNPEIKRVSTTTILKTTTTPEVTSRPTRNDVIDRGVIDRGVVVRPPNIIISRDDESDVYRDQNYQNVSTKGTIILAWAQSLLSTSQFHFNSDYFVNLVFLRYFYLLDKVEFT